MKLQEIPSAARRVAARTRGVAEAVAAKNPCNVIGICVAWLLAVAPAHAQVPQMIHYQGRISVGGPPGGIPYNGPGYFKFALVDGAGGWYWSNDGTWVVPAGGGPPTPVNSVQLQVDHGLYSVPLGSALPALGMVPILPTIFQNPIVYLRLWFSDNAAGPFVLQTPDIRILSVGYSMNAATVVDGAIDESKLADKAVTSTKLADGAVTIDKLATNSVSSVQLASEITLGNAGYTLEGGATHPGEAGELRLYSGALTFQPSITLAGADGSITASDAFIVGGLVQTQAVLSVQSSRGVLRLYDEDKTEAVSLHAKQGGGDLWLYQNDGKYGVSLTGDAFGLNSGGLIKIADGDGRERINLAGDSSGAGLITIRNSAGEEAVTIGGNSSGGAGGVLIYQADGATVGVDLRADADGGGGRVLLRQADGDIGVYIDGNDENGGGYLGVRNAAGNSSVRLYGAQSANDDGGRILLYNANQVQTVEIDGDDPGSGGWIGLYDSSGTKRIELDANTSGGARITTQVLEITGGSDLSENFDITPLADAKALNPGALVCIDPENPGQLTVSTKAYDRTVAGIMSGAGGVKPGMLMGQHGTAANGKHPVALSGRVYCMADASNGAIQPGDLLTTSELPGHAMKVTDHGRAQGAIIGKAMTALTADQGLVLVLVTLQ